LDWLRRQRGRYDEAAGEVIQIEQQYFDRHGDHLAYATVEAQGCPKGSGAIESTCSQLQDRFKRTGQFWTLRGENCLLALDLARRNNDWDEIWKIAA
jgi:hypothetical protein